MELLILAQFFLAWALASPTQPTKPDCAELAKAGTNPTVDISQAVEVPPNSLNISSTVNKVSLCWVQGTIKYSAENDKLDASGNNTLTWELFLPDSAKYNGRYLMIGREKSDC
jgi:hypothetical protein